MKREAKALNSYNEFISEELFDCLYDREAAEIDISTERNL